jgi:hypothetical protein
MLFAVAILRDAAKTPLLRMRPSPRPAMTKRRKSGTWMRLRDDLPNPHGEERGNDARLEPEAADACSGSAA